MHDSRVGAGKPASVAKYLAWLGALSLTGCITITGYVPVKEGIKVYEANGYSVSGCHENLDKQAGQPTDMTWHTEGPILAFSEVFYLGMLPLYTCKGVPGAPQSTAGPGAPVGASER
jgi:hypothetical protein